MVDVFGSIIRLCTSRLKRRLRTKFLFAVRTLAKSFGIKWYSLSGLTTRPYVDYITLCLCQLMQDFWSASITRNVSSLFVALITGIFGRLAVDSFWVYLSIITILSCLCKVSLIADAFLTFVSSGSQIVHELDCRFPHKVNEQFSCYECHLQDGVRHAILRSPFQTSGGFLNDCIKNFLKYSITVESSVIASSFYAGWLLYLKTLLNISTYSTKLFVAQTSPSPKSSINHTPKGKTMSIKLQSFNSDMPSIPN